MENKIGFHLVVNEPLRVRDSTAVEDTLCTNTPSYPHNSHSMRIIGIMSGTSVDSIDIAYCEVAEDTNVDTESDPERVAATSTSTHSPLPLSASPPLCSPLPLSASPPLCGIVAGRHITLQLLRQTEVPWDPDLRARILAMIHGSSSTPAVPVPAAAAQAVCELNVAIGEYLAIAVNLALAEFAAADALDVSATTLAALDTAHTLPSVDLIACHGQTIWHSPHTGSTLQIGEPSVIAARTGITTVSDFRTADMAAGGQGAPLTSTFDCCFLTPFLRASTSASASMGTSPSSTEEASAAAARAEVNVENGPPDARTGSVCTSTTRAVQNIGGIGNVTLLTAWNTGLATSVTEAETEAGGDGFNGGNAAAGGGGDHGDRGDDALDSEAVRHPSLTSSPNPSPVAFDTGPGNCLIDLAAAACGEAAGGPAVDYDEDGRFAAAGTCSAELLAEIYGECASYFDAPPPKTTGREAMFSRGAFRRWHGRSQDLGMSADGFDLCATLTELTALTIAEACVRWAPTRLKDCVVSGGGARNPVLMGRLEHHLNRLAAARWGGCGSGAGGYGAGEWGDAEEGHWGGELGGGGSNVGSGVCVGTDANANGGVGSGGTEDRAVGCGGNHDESKACAMSPAGAANTVVGASTTMTSTTTSKGRRRPPRVALLRHEELGIDSDAKEAMVFALLGFLCIRGLPGNVPSCTGATRLCVLGKISPGANMAGLFGASVA